MNVPYAELVTYLRARVEMRGKIISEPESNRWQGYTLKIWNSEKDKARGVTPVEIVSDKTRQGGGQNRAEFPSANVAAAILKFGFRPDAKWERKYQLIESSPEYAAKYPSSWVSSDGHPTGPVIDHPVVDHPVVDHPVVDHPVVDHPVVDHPVVDHPIVEPIKGTGGKKKFPAKPPPKRPPRG